MVPFATFLRELAERRGLRREADGMSVTYRLKMSGSTVITILTHEVETVQPDLVLSEPWPIPASEALEQEFLREALSFNRNALHHLHAGIRPDPLGGAQYRLTWQVPAIQQAQSNWTSQLRLFALLTEKAWQTLPRPGERLLSRANPQDDANLIFMP